MLSHVILTAWFNFGDGGQKYILRISIFLLWFTQLTHFYKYLATICLYLTSSGNMHLQYYGIVNSVGFMPLSRTQSSFLLLIHYCQ